MRLEKRKCAADLILPRRGGRFGDLSGAAVIMPARQGARAKAHRVINSTTDHYQLMSATAAATLTPAADELSAAATELRLAAESKVKEFAGALKNEDLQSLADRAVKEATTRWEEVSEQVAAFIKESPGKAVLAALGIGFALGAMFRRD
jgi:ElaB/YqjD/DUF883 family membrane-anchored ribosome-binding protein